jgi:hypothetical protein
VKSVTALRSDCQELGVAHSEGSRVYFSLSINRSYSVLCTQGAIGVQTPSEVNLEIATRRETQETRNFVVIVEGNLRWLQKFREGLEDPDVVIYVAPEPVLLAMGIRALDEGWQPGDEPRDSPEAFIASGSGEPTEPSADEFGFPEDSLDREVRSAPVDLLGEMSRAVSGDDRLGRCYELAGNWVSSRPNAVLVHGSIQGPNMPRIDHAWAITVDGAVYEPVSDRLYSPDEFGDLFDDEEERHYTAQQVWATTLKTGHWGPWESVRQRLAPQMEEFRAALQHTALKSPPEAPVAPDVASAAPVAPPVPTAPPVASVAATPAPSRPRTVRRTESGTVPDFPKDLRPASVPDGPVFDPAALDPDFHDPAAEGEPVLASDLVVGAEVEEVGTGIRGVVESLTERIASVRFLDDEDESIVPLSELRIVGAEEEEPSTSEMHTQDIEAELEVPAGKMTEDDEDDEDDDTLFLV